jgi:hypothetical protein
MMHYFTESQGGKKSACSKLDTLEQRLACLADAGLPAIEDRLNELEREWTAGRITKAVLGVLLVVGFAMTAIFSPWWLVLPAVGGVFLLQYLFSRTSWLGVLFHKLGYRTGWEVDQEKMALKVLRGDFRHLPTILDVESQEDISRLEGEGGIVLEPETSKVDPKEAARSALDAAKS